MKTNRTLMPGEMPKSLEAEAAVIGAVLLDNGALTRVSDLTPSMFYAAFHAEAFRTIQSMAAAGQAFDVIAVFDAMRADGKAEQDAIEASADQIALLFTDWAHPLSKREPAFEGFSELEIVAHRNGAQGLVPLHFNGKYQQITDWDGSVPVHPAATASRSRGMPQ